MKGEDTLMERRQFLAGLAGIAGAAAIAMALPRHANALTADTLTDTTPQEGGLLDELKAGSEESVKAEGVEVAQHRGDRHRRHGPPRRHHHNRRRRVRRRQFRQVCNRYRNRWGAWVRRCRREPIWVWHWI